ncbi:D-2-hydroxyacid dehydrogenase [Salinisphaera sp. SPP-AMP-43]|uniref:D-2-hydroxyacid dehydrogenase n=1 Tax=Salinisphaera sp. SPP-AMP-43 TaxID=3121288 RepID=UPI003C6DDC7E
MRACFLDAGSVGERLDWSKLENAVDQWQWFHNTKRDEVALRLADVDIAVTNKVILDAETIDAAEQLKLICVAATGTNNVDTAAAARRGIPVINVSGYSTPAVAQHVLALMLAFATRWHDYDRAVARGAWQASEFFCLLDYPIEELAGATLGIVGYGELGAAVARRATAFDMEVLISERPGAEQVRDSRLSFPEVLERADFLSLHCPLTEATHHLIDRDALARMKSSAFLINTARGPIVDSQALLTALREQQIAGAAIDVLDHEPPREGHPLLDAELDNLIVTPHTAWASRAARQRVIDGVADNIAVFCAGDDSRRVN